MVGTHQRSTDVNLPPKRIVILGATSAIAHGIAKRYAASGSLFFLVARNEERTQQCAQELLAAGAAGVRSMVVDLRVRDLHDGIVSASFEHLGTVDMVLVAFAAMPAQSTLDRDVNAALDVLITDAMSPVSLMHRYALVLEQQGSGSLVVFSSVAGERGRRGNFVYGSAKSLLNAYTSGLRAMTHDSGVHVLTVKPGPVETPMTAGKNLPLTVGVDRVATDIIRAIESKRLVIYTPGLWRFIMAIFRLLPERIAMRLKI
jgi:decaprenylphospho-beta-D-erythro-pentofuranosid-2-ulose 2-reductase